MADNRPGVPQIPNYLVPARINGEAPHMYLLPDLGDKIFGEGHGPMFSAEELPRVLETVIASPEQPWCAPRFWQCAMCNAHVLMPSTDKLCVSPEVGNPALHSEVCKQNYLCFRLVGSCLRHDPAAEVQVKACTVGGNVDGVVGLAVCEAHDDYKRIVEMVSVNPHLARECLVNNAEAQQHILKGIILLWNKSLHLKDTLGQSRVAELAVKALVPTNIWLPSAIPHLQNLRPALAAYAAGEPNRWA